MYYTNKTRDQVWPPGQNSHGSLVSKDIQDKTTLTTLMPEIWESSSAMLKAKSTLRESYPLTRCFHLLTCTSG